MWALHTFQRFVAKKKTWRKEGSKRQEYILYLKKHGNDLWISSLNMWNLNIFRLQIDYGVGYGSEFDEQEAAER